MKRLLLVLGLYLVFVTIIGVGLGSINIPKFHRLASECVQTDATITATDCRNHSTVMYTFEVGGQPISSKGLSGGDRPCSEFQPGDRVPVWYIPSDPAVNTLRDPAYRLKNELISVGCAATVMTSFLIVIFAVRWLLRAKNEQ